MIIRKLTAAVIASTVMTSGAWAQTSTTEATTDVELVITPQAQVDAVTELKFADNAGNGDSVGSGASSGLCTWTNTSDFNLTVVSTNDWDLIGENESEEIGYELEAGTLNFTTETGPFDSTTTDLFISANPCAGPDTVDADYIELTATLTENTDDVRADTYKDTVTFTIAPI
jgi:hypothetical protein